MKYKGAIYTCPSCTAPIEINKNVEQAKCIFCGNNFILKKNNTNQNTNIDIRKTLDRAINSLEKGYYDKALKQYEILVNSIGKEYNDEFLECIINYYYVRLKIFLIEQYEIPNGEVIIYFRRNLEELNDNDKNYKYRSLDEFLSGILESIEDNTQGLELIYKRTIYKKIYNNFYIELNKYIPLCNKWIVSNASIKSITKYDEDGSHKVKIAIESPVYHTLLIYCELYSFLLSLLGRFDLDDNKKNEKLRIYKETKDVCFTDIVLPKPHSKNYSYETIKELPSVSALIDKFEALGLELKPLIEEEEEAKRAKKEELKLKQVLLNEAKRKEDELRKREWIASPAYKKQQAYIRTAGVVIAGLFMYGIIFSNPSNEKRTPTNNLEDIRF